VGAHEQTARVWGRTASWKGQTRSDVASCVKSLEKGQQGGGCGPEMREYGVESQGRGARAEGVGRK